MGLSACFVPALAERRVRLACFLRCKYRNFLNKLQVLPCFFDFFLKIEFSLKKVA